MQITHIEVIPIELSLQAPYRAVYTANQDVNRAAAVFIRASASFSLRPTGARYTP